MEFCRAVRVLACSGSCMFFSGYYNSSELPSTRRVMITGPIRIKSLGFEVQGLRFRAYA